MCDRYRETYFSQKKNLSKWAENGFATTSLSWKLSMGQKHIDSPVKKQFQTKQLVKKAMLIDFYDMKRHIALGFFF